MIDLKNSEDVKVLQSYLRTSLESPSGKEVMKFLEQLCGWYDFSEVEPSRIQIAHGKRQVLATIKTLLEFKPDQIVALMREKEEV